MGLTSERKSTCFEMLGAAILLVLLTFTPFAQKPEEKAKAVERSEQSIALLGQFAALGSESVPYGLLRGAKAIALFPNTRKYSILLSEMMVGRGVACVRTGSEWSMPAFVTLKGSDMNLKIASKKSFDLFVIFFDEKFIDEFKKGGIATGGGKQTNFVLGPVIKGKATDATLEKAKAVYYVFEKGQLIDVDLANNSWIGVFGISHDNDLNKAIFGVKAKEIFAFSEKVKKPQEQIEKFRKTFIETLTNSIPKTTDEVQE